MESVRAESPTRPAIGWYVHLPFCATKCGYCDFYSLPTIPGLIEGLVRALETELARRDPGRSVETIFIGGGTPTVLPGDALARILAAVVDRAGPAAEFTVEANPSSTDELKLDLLRRFGVNRISFGAQSFDSHELAVLERLHDPRHVEASVRAARAAGFDNVNLDLIYAIPGQTIGSWRNSLRRALDLGPDHLSCYALTYEPGTSLTRMRLQGRVVSADEALEAEMFALTIDALKASGFEHYEISNFARPGRRCRANLIYWENREYLGVGPSAVSYLDGTRRKNLPDVRRYVEVLSGLPRDGATGAIPELIAEQETLSPLQRAGETAVQMLRLIEGIDFGRFSALTGYDARVLFDEAVAKLAPLGVIQADQSGIRLTDRGLPVANRVMEHFLIGSAAVVSTATSSARGSGSGYPWSAT